MSLSELGKKLRTNNVDIGQDVVTKEFKGFYPSMLWAVLERKPLSGKTARYNRDVAVITALQDNTDLHTPTLISKDDKNHTLKIKALELTDFVDLFSNSEIHEYDKLGYLAQALRTLLVMHNSGQTHGDAYLKNFFRIDGVENNNEVYTCDFEFNRLSPSPEMTDVLMLTANAINSLVAHKVSPQMVLNLVSEQYGANLDFPFDMRDRLFFRLRFKMGELFFQHFTSNKKTF